MKAYLKIEMPKSCASCEWSKLSKMDLGMSCFCTRAKKTGSLEIAKNNRMDFCPLVTVPPHGDLIDRDALLDTATIHWSQTTNESCFPIDEIEYAPTIIPAEEGE